MSQYPVKALEAAGRYFVRNSGGIKALAHRTVYRIPHDARGNLLEAGARRVVSMGLGTHISTDDRAEWLHKNGIKTHRRDPDTVYKDVFGKAGSNLVYQYMKKHGYVLYRDPKDGSWHPYWIMDPKTGKIVKA